jgi:hypothetical protein
MDDGPSAPLSPPSTLVRAAANPSKAQRQQYLTPFEEKAVIDNNTCVSLIHVQTI